MHLNLLNILNLRNLSSVDLMLNSQCNVFCGRNGSGKTSILEAINLLATGRSFRTTKAGPMIRFGEKSCLVSGVVSSKNLVLPSQSVRLGIERFLTGSPKIRLAEQDCQSIIQLARVLPVQLINTDSYELLETSPQIRRQFLDWLMFHVEHSFYSTWQRFKRALAQRNALLKNYGQLNLSELRIWDKELVETGEILDIARKHMLEAFYPVFLEILSGLLNFKERVSIQYNRGWSDNLNLAEALERSLNRDKEWRYTTVGPQRADLEFVIGGVPAKNMLSRGQLKLFVCALLMARAVLLYQKSGRRCVFLVDDLHSELDKEANRLLAQSLHGWGGQVLITTIEGESLAGLLKGEDHTMFHVEHGQIRQM